MSWNGKQFNKPFIFLHKEDLSGTVKYRGYKISDEENALFPTDQISGELALQILLQHGLTEQAVNLLSACMIPRVAVWWAYLCLNMVMDDIAQDFAKDGLTPRERRKAHVEKLTADMTDMSDIDEMVSSRMAYLHDQNKLIEEELSKLEFLSPGDILQKKLAYIQEFIEYMKSELPPEELGSPDDPIFMEDELKQLMQAAQKNIDQLIEAQTPKEVIIDDSVSFTPVYEALEKKTQAIKPAIEAEMSKFFPLKLKGLPPKPSPEKKAAAVQAALRWLLVPSDENGQLACQAAIAAQSGPESMLAYAAFWSSTNLKTETGIAPTNPALPPLGISKTLLQLALLEGGDMDYDERYRKFLELGIECADGTCTWDEHGNPVRSKAPSASTSAADDRIFRTRSGFGRQA